ncbi:MAG: carboxymuconolactone decarboxylase family protein [Gammaproteobacteria bacterium]|nr:carboxymuconolactone decarboxylase family protein [Gammaproteobacteria bacterium]
MPDAILSSRARDIADQYPDIWQKYQQLGKACAESGPLDGKTQRLIKLALAIGAGSEGAVHSHIRRALDQGISVNELRHVATLAIPTLGFPKGVAALTWMDDLLAEEAK